MSGLGNCSESAARLCLCRSRQRRLYSDALGCERRQVFWTQCLHRVWDHRFTSDGAAEVGLEDREVGAVSVGEGEWMARLVRR